MKKSNTIIDIMQVLLTEQEVKEVCDILGYKDTSRKFTVYSLLKFFIAAATGEWKSFRHGAENTADYGLETIDYSTVSKKATKVNYKITKKLFELLVSKCNRVTKRTLKLPKDLLAIDSTTITVGKPRLKWAKYKGQRSGVKLHVAFNVAQMMPVKVEETIALKHDGPIGEKLTNTTCILVEDRAYGKHERFDKFKEEGQSFVIRIKGNIHIIQPKSLKRMDNKDSSIIKDITCKLGKDDKQTKNRFRVVEFKDFKGKYIRVCTDMLNLSAEKIAAIYKERWNIETFFRFIKQNLNVKRLFGTSQNSVYNQLFCGFIAYILLHFFYMETSQTWKYVKLSFVEFTRKLCKDTLQIEVYISIDFLMQKIKNQDNNRIENIG
ncbi:IS4 family transposase [Clostridium tepidiprofundi]|nr:IS4 family transposase [Clostridium tepidiprofundi]